MTAVLEMSAVRRFVDSVISMYLWGVQRGGACTVQREGIEWVTELGDRRFGMFPRYDEQNGRNQSKTGRLRPFCFNAPLVVR